MLPAVKWFCVISPRAAAMTFAVLALLIGSAGAQQTLEGGKSDEIAKELKNIAAELRAQRQLFIIRLGAIEERMKRLEDAGRSSAAVRSGSGKKKKGRSKDRSARSAAKGAPPDPAQFANAPATVCRQGCPFTELKTALNLAKDGDTITVAPGLYGMCAVIKKSVILRGLRDKAGKRAHLGGGVCWGKGALVAVAPKILIEGFEISNVKVGSKNGACVRIDKKAKDVTIRDIFCHDSENGILGGGDRGVVTIENSRFERNGADNGRAHGIYITRSDSLVFRNSQIFSAKEGGHSLKSGARRTLVEDSVIAALDGRNSRAIDIFGGGELIVRRSVLQQGKHSENHDAVGVAKEPRRLNPEPHSTLLEDNWIIFDDPKRCCGWLFSANEFGPFTVRGNKIVGMTEAHLPSIEKQVADNNKLFKTRSAAGLPTYDGTANSLPKPGK